MWNSEPDDISKFDALMLMSLDTDQDLINDIKEMNDGDEMLHSEYWGDTEELKITFTKSCGITNIEINERKYILGKCY